MRSQINWGLSTTEQRRALYLVIRDVMAEHSLTLNQIFDKVMGKPFALGRDYESNFRKGLISRAKAVSIYRWLQREHPHYARAVEKNCLGENYRADLGYRSLKEMSAEELQDAMQAVLDEFASAKEVIFNAADAHVYKHPRGYTVRECEYEKFDHMSQGTESDLVTRVRNAIGGQPPRTSKNCSRRMG